MCVHFVLESTFTARHFFSRIASNLMKMEDKWVTLRGRIVIDPSAMTIEVDPTPLDTVEGWNYHFHFKA